MYYNLKIRHKLSLLSVSLLFMVDCNNIVHNWQGGAIDRYGEYRMLNNKVVIFVSEDSNLLNYVVKNEKGDTLIKTSENSGIFQSWMLFWDSKENLWVCSSDIGNWVWKKNSQGRYGKVYVLPDTTLIHEVPGELRRFHK